MKNPASGGVFGNGFKRLISLLLCVIMPSALNQYNFGQSMKTLAGNDFVSPHMLGRRVPTRSERKLRQRLITNERALREVLKELRDRDRLIESYTVEDHGRGFLWVRYQVIPSGTFTPGFHKPVITINLRSEEHGMVVEGNSRLINVVFDRYLDMNEWRRLLEEQMEIRLRGWRSEEQVYKAAEQLIVEEGNPIISISPASAHHDREGGTDLFFICTGNSGVEKVPLQCKTGVFGQTAHRMREPSVPSLLIRPGMSDEDIRKKLLEIVKKYLVGEIIHV